MTLDDYYESHYPEHSRTSCSDEHPINADAGGSGCHRCNAILFTQHGLLSQKLEIALTTLKVIREEEELEYAVFAAKAAIIKIARMDEES